MLSVVSLRPVYMYVHSVSVSLSNQYADRADQREYSSDSSRLSE